MNRSASLEHAGDGPSGDRVRAPRAELVPEPVDTMTERQLEKRRAVLDATLELIGEHGPDRVQVRQVSERSGIALKTVYRYFASKEHLFASALVDWLHELSERTMEEMRQGSRGDGPSERVIWFMGRGAQAFHDNPNLARLEVTVSSSTDPLASSVIRDLRRLSSETMKSLLPEVPAARLDVLVRIVNACWASELLSWVTGSCTADEAFRNLEEVVRVVMEPYATTRTSG